MTLGKAIHKEIKREDRKNKLNNTKNKVKLLLTSKRIGKQTESELLNIKYEEALAELIYSSAYYGNNCNMVKTPGLYISRFIVDNEVIKSESEKIYADTKDKIGAKFIVTLRIRLYKDGRVRKSIVRVNRQIK